MTWEQLTPLLVEGGMPPERITQATSQLYDPGRWFPTCALIAGWGRRPR